MPKNIFIKSPNFYKRNIDPINQYINLSSSYLSKMTGDDIEKCKSFIKTQITNIKDPTVKYYSREENGDTSIQLTKLSNYINDIITNGDILAPTGTTYIHPNIKESVIVSFMDNNIILRSMAKKLAQKAEGVDDDTFIFANNEQNNRKIFNNSFSGIFGNEGSVFYNQTGHSTLTSTTRLVSSFANACNEKFIGGNRHYRNPNITFNNIITIINNTNYGLLRRVMVNYDLEYPTTEMALECINRSTKHYWRNDVMLQNIIDLLNKLKPIELAAFVYSGDLFHLRKHNECIIKTFLTELSKKVIMPYDPDLDLPSFIRNSEESIVNLAHVICFDEVEGLGKDYEKMLEKGVVQYVAGTIDNVNKVLETYSEFIEAFFITDNLPVSVAYIPEIIRQGVVLSDTDSTCVSIDEWVTWYFGEIHFDSLSIGLAGSVMFLAVESLIHILAMFSANMNVEKNKLNKLSMKSEFFWPIMVPTNVAKHYFALPLIKEGNVYSNININNNKVKLEIKGVHLRNSNTPKTIRTLSTKLMKEIMFTVYNNKKLDIAYYVNTVVDIELDIRQSLIKGELKFYRNFIIKDVDAYIEDAEDSFYRHHIFWNEVFGDKYGSIDAPPYTVAKVSVMLESRGNFNRWINSIADEALKTKLITWVDKNGKNTLPSIYIPVNYLGSKGMLEEIKPIIDVKRITLDICNSLYIILESIGFYKKQDMLLNEYLGKTF